MKKQFSRRHRALRSLGLLLAVALMMQVFNIYNFTPTAALRDKEREMGLPSTEILARRGYTESLDVLLSARGDRLMVSELHGDILQGWLIHNAWSLQRAPEEAVQIRDNLSGNQSASHLWLSGWVADPDVAELNLRLRCRQWYGTAKEKVDVYLTVTEFIPWQGERVFLLTTDEIPASYTLEDIYLITDAGETLLPRNK